MAVQTSTTVPPSTMPLISPQALLQAYLSQSPPTRPSNRSPAETRPINLNTGSLTHCNGSSLVRIGESTIVCGIRAEILPVSEIPHYRAEEDTRAQSRPADEDASEDETYESVTLNNLLVPNLELSTNSHPSFPPNVAPSITAQSLSQRILSLLHTTRLVPTADLEIRHSSDPSVSTDLDPDDPAFVEPERNVLKAYWVLYIDCVCLGYGGEGNLFDACVCAIVAALRDVRLPAARWDEDSKMVYCNADYSRAKRLQLRGVPCPLGFGVFVADPKLNARVNGAAVVKSSNDADAVVLIDTDSFEDDVCEEKGNVVVDCSSGKCQVLRMEKVGGRGRLGVEGTKHVVQAAEKRWSEWKGVLDGATIVNG